MGTEQKRAESDGEGGYTGRKSLHGVMRDAWKYTGNLSCSLPAWAMTGSLPTDAQDRTSCAEQHEVLQSFYVTPGHHAGGTSMILGPARAKVPQITSETQ